MIIVEVLLARTRADAVPPIAIKLLRKYPTSYELAGADMETLENILKPLGLFRKRSKALKHLAYILNENYDGIVPKNEKLLMSLPYVGRYAANAVLCFSFDKRNAVVDANVARVIHRFFTIPKHKGKLEHCEEYWILAQKLLPRKNLKNYNWGLLDIGGLICLPRKPLCSQCPLSRKCKKEGVTHSA
jgi:A/G-specific adenine glycosylase